MSHDVEEKMRGTFGLGYALIAKDEIVGGVTRRGASAALVDEANLFVCTLARDGHDGDSTLQSALDLLENFLDFLGEMAPPGMYLMKIKILLKKNSRS